MPRYRMIEHTQELINEFLCICKLQLRIPDLDELQQFSQVVLLKRILREIFGNDPWEGETVCAAEIHPVRVAMDGIIF